jgi:hippurate hydrolase
MRCFSTATQAMLSRRIEEVAHQAVATAEDASAEAKLRWITPPLINAREQTQVSVKAASTVAGANVNPNAGPITGGEDFAYMMEARPGAFIFIGNGTAEDGRVHNVHTPKFDFNDRSIPYGVEYWVKLVQQELAG